jgi:hypothetical protein
MPFLAAAAPLLAAGTTALGGSAVTAGIVGGAASLAGGLASSSAANKANAQAAQAAKVDINALDEQTRKIAKQNALDSAALEAELTPEVPTLRKNANEAVISGLNDQTLSKLGTNLSVGMDGGYQSPLLRGAIAKAAEQLALGGKLDPELQNLVTRKSLAAAGTVAPGSVALGRDLTARDLGLTRMDLLNKRIAQASGLGQLELGANQANEQKMLTRAQLIASLQGARYGQALGAAQYGQSIAQPIVGLDPTAVANVSVGNATNQSKVYANQADAYGKQANNAYQGAGTFFGNAFANYKPSTGYVNAQNGGINPATGQSW